MTPSRAEIMAAFREMDALAATGEDTLGYREAFDKWWQLAQSMCQRCGGSGTINLGTSADAEYWPCLECWKDGGNP